jgi:hypothetical protein
MAGGLPDLFGRGENFFARLLTRMIYWSLKHNYKVQLMHTRRLLKAKQIQIGIRCEGDFIAVAEALERGENMREEHGVFFTIFDAFRKSKGRTAC